jgi:hypothetical protein
MRSAVQLALLVLALLVAVPSRAEWRDIAYSDVAKMPLMLKKVDPQHVFTYFYRVVPAKGQQTLPPDLKLQVSADGQVVPVAFQADGRVDLPIRQDWQDAGAKIQINQPKGKVLISFTLNSRVPPGTRMSYGELTESAPVLERGIKEMAGLMSFLAPKVTVIVLKFDKSAAQTVTLALPDGQKKVWKTDAEGQIQLPWEPDWSSAAVMLSAPLKGIDQVMK